MSSVRRRKGVVTSCIPCYKKKQKCNRRYPCDHCTRRRRPEECVYRPKYSQASRDSQEADGSSGVPSGEQDAPSQDASGGIHEPVNVLPNASDINLATAHESDSFAPLFGYVEHSNLNTAAFLRRLDPESHVNHDKDVAIPIDAYNEIEQLIKKIPGRDSLDVLIQVYATEIYWIEQLVHAPWFLTQYQEWWSLGRLSLVFDVEFIVLVLRICNYTLQHIPIASRTADQIGVSLSDACEECNGIAEKLSAICQRINPSGSLLRVQHLLFRALQLQCTGRTDTFWEALSDAIRVAQRIGLHRGRAAWPELHEFEQDIRCKVYCSLYIWDSRLAKQLDVNPMLPAALSPEHLPRVVVPCGDDEEPDNFLERVLQARLAAFWRTFAYGASVAIPTLVAEELYNRFCIEFLGKLPPSFALMPNEGFAEHKPGEKWDGQRPKLPLQRQMLHIAIFDYICHLFRPMLARGSKPRENLPVEKRSLPTAHKRKLASSAVAMLDNISKSYLLLARSHISGIALILPTFEAAVILAALLSDEHSGIFLGEGHTTRDYCLREFHRAHARLEILAKTSPVAKTYASTLSRIMSTNPSDSY